MTENEKKYDRIVKEIGIIHLRPLILSKKEEIQKALEEGDIHLNSIPLEWWDRISGVRQLYGGKYHMDHNYPWSLYPYSQSPAFRVCVLKHVAKFYLEER